MVCDKHAKEEFILSTTKLTTVKPRTFLEIFLKFYLTFFVKFESIEMFVSKVYDCIACFKLDFVRQERLISRIARFTCIER